MLHHGGDSAVLKKILQSALKMLTALSLCYQWLPLLLLPQRQLN